MEEADIFQGPRKPADDENGKLTTKKETQNHALSTIKGRGATMSSPLPLNVVQVIIISVKQWEPAV